MPIAPYALNLPGTAPAPGPYLEETYFATSYFPPIYWGWPNPSGSLTIREAVCAKALADATFTGLVSTNLTPNRIPQIDSLPAVTYTLVQNVRDRDLLGPVGTSWAQIRFETWSTDQRDIIHVNESLRTLFDGFQGTLPGGVIVLEALMDNEEDAVETIDTGSGLPANKSGCDFLFHYRESTPNRL